jgi:hypothetical protein
MVLSRHDKSCFVLKSNFCCSVLVKPLCCYESLDSYISVAKTISLLGCDTVLLGKWILVFHKIVIVLKCLSLKF